MKLVLNSNLKEMPVSLNVIPDAKRTDLGFGYPKLTLLKFDLDIADMKKAEMD